jgi:NitT/TauT family transport system substrate-binding protein
MRRRTVLSGLLSSLALPAVGGRVSAQATLEKLKVAGPPTEDAVNIYYAVKTGMFARAGVDLEMYSTNSGTAATTAVVAGSYDLARTSTIAVFTAFLRNIPVAIVAPEKLWRSAFPNALLQIAVNSTYKTGADLNGKTIGAPALNDFNVLATKVWVDKNGGDWKSLKFVEIPNSALESAIVSHRIDAAVLQTAQLDASLAAGTTKTLGDAQGSIAPTFLAGVYMARTDWATKHVELVRTFNRVMNEASNYVNTHFAETAALVGEFTKAELNAATRMHRTFSATSLDPAQLQPVIDAAAKYEHISRGFRAKDIMWP